MSDQNTRDERSIKIYRGSTQRTPIKTHQAGHQSRAGMVSRVRDAEARQSVRTYSGSRYGA